MYALQNIKSTPGLYVYHLNELNKKIFKKGWGEIGEEDGVDKKHEGKVRITYKVSVPIPFSGIYFGLTKSQKSKRGI